MSRIFQKPPFNYQYQVGIANLIDYEIETVSAVGNTGGDAPLQDVVMPSGVLIQDGQKITLVGIGTKQNPVGAVTMGVKLNGVSIFSFTAIAAAALVGWRIETELIRQGTDLLITTKAEHTFDTGVSALATPTFRQNRIVQAAFNFAQSAVLQFFANVPTAGENVTQNASHLYVL